LAALGEVEIAQITFDYDEITNEQVTRQTLTLPIKVNIAAENEKRTANDEVVKQVLLLDAAHARKEAIQYADKGDFPTATNILNQAAQNIMESGVLDEELRGEHNQLREEAVSMEF